MVGQLEVAVYARMGRFTLIRALIGLWSAVVWQQMGSPASFDLIEIGPGRGTLMRDALRAVRRPYGVGGAVTPGRRAAGVFVWFSLRPGRPGVHGGGVARARRFSWSDTAQRTLDVYRELLS